MEKDYLPENLRFTIFKDILINKTSIGFRDISSSLHNFNINNTTNLSLDAM
jgi:hypothetical protein